MNQVFTKIANENKEVNEETSTNEPQTDEQDNNANATLSELEILNKKKPIESQTNKPEPEPTGININSIIEPYSVNKNEQKIIQETVSNNITSERIIKNTPESHKSMLSIHKYSLENSIYFVYTERKWTSKHNQTRTLKSKELLQKYENFIIQRRKYSGDNDVWENFFGGSTFKDFMAQRTESNINKNAKYHLKISIFGTLSILLDKPKKPPNIGIDKLLLIKLIGLLPYEIDEKDCNMNLFNGIMDLFWIHSKYSNTKRKNFKKGPDIIGFTFSAIGISSLKHYFDAEFVDYVTSDQPYKRITSKELDNKIINYNELLLDSIPSSTFSEFYNCPTKKTTKKKRKSSVGNTTTNDNDNKKTKKRKLNNNNEMKMDNDNNNCENNLISSNNNNNCEKNLILSNNNNLPPNIYIENQMNYSIPSSAPDVAYTVYEVPFTAFIVFIQQSVEYIRHYFEKGNIFIALSALTIFPPISESWNFKYASSNIHNAYNKTITLPLYPAHIEKTSEVKVYYPPIINNCLILIKNPVKVPKKLTIQSSINQINIPNPNTKDLWKETIDEILKKGYKEKET